MYSREQSDSGDALVQAVKSNAFRKTKLCPRVAKSGFCPAKNCSFAHTNNELRPLPNFQKTALCFNYKKGKCTDVNCRYAHGDDELRGYAPKDKEAAEPSQGTVRGKVPICPMYLLGVCLYKANCVRGDHPKLASREAKIAGQKMKDFQDNIASVCRNKMSIGHLKEAWQAKFKCSLQWEILGFETLHQAIKSVPGINLHENGGVVDEIILFFDADKKHSDETKQKHLAGVIGGMERSRRAIHKGDENANGSPVNTERQARNYDIVKADTNGSSPRKVSSPQKSTSNIDVEWNPELIKTVFKETQNATREWKVVPHGGRAFFSQLRTQHQQAEAFQCVICECVAGVPVVTVCSHVFCSGCFDEWRRQHLKHSPAPLRTLPCPQCNQALRHNEVFLLESSDHTCRAMLGRLYSSLQIMCPFHREHLEKTNIEELREAMHLNITCDWSGDIRDYLDHYKVCSARSNFSKRPAASSNASWIGQISFSCQLSYNGPPLPINVGQQVEITREDPAGWLYAKILPHGPMGWLPRSYVSREDEEKSGEFLVATDDFDVTEGSEQLGLKANDIIRVMVRDPSGWTCGSVVRRGGVQVESTKAGWFPETYCKPVERC